MMFKNVKTMNFSFDDCLLSLKHDISIENAKWIVINELGSAGSHPATAFFCAEWGSTPNEQLWPATTISTIGQTNFIPPLHTLARARNVEALNEASPVSGWRTAITPKKYLHTHID